MWVGSAFQGRETSRKILSPKSSWFLDHIQEGINSMSNIKITDELVMALLQVEKKALTTGEVAEKFHISYTSAYYHLDSLWLTGRISRELIQGDMGAPKGRWSLN